MNIEYIIYDDFDYAKERGWSGIGWYFWDESGYYCYGPYETEEIAKEKSKEYGLQID
jgi:hypothetical protein